MRIPTDQTAGEVAAFQLAALAKMFSRHLLVVADRYYGRAAFLTALLEQETSCDALLRIKADRVYYRSPPPHRRMAAIIAKLDTPALSPKLRGKSPGSVAGPRLGRAKRYAVVKKGSKRSAKANKLA